jgi:diadenosine tetraphosphate (Ap4A) HIT family hydrolase
VPARRRRSCSVGGDTRETLLKVNFGVPEDAARPLPDWVHWSGFPFEGDIKVRPFKPPDLQDRPRSGEPGGPPCEACRMADENFIWVDDLWRVSVGERVALPIQVLLTPRRHVDQHELDGELAATLGVMIARLDRAITAIPQVGRVHTARFGDGGSHFHMYFNARPRGSSQMIAWALQLWSTILEPTPEQEWGANLATVASELAKEGGVAIGIG